MLIFNILQNLLNTADNTLFIMSKLTIDYIFSQGFQISFRFFEAKFLPRIYVEGKFSKEIGKERDRMCLPKQNSSFFHLVV